MPFLIFDLDDTLYNPDTRTLCTDTKEVLQTLSALGHTLTVCSHNVSAVDILKRVGIFHHFETVVGDCCGLSKIPQLQQLLLQHPTVLYQDMIFFDDLSEHCTAFANIGIRTVHVKWQTGITMDDINFLLL